MADEAVGWRSWNAPPPLFTASLIAEPGGLLAIPGRLADGAWRNDGRAWSFAGRLDSQGNHGAAYHDPVRGVVIVTWERDELVRYVWGGTELDRHRLDFRDRRITSLAYDPIRGSLVIVGGPHGTLPWTIAISAAGEVTTLPVFGSVAFDPERQRLIASVDVEVSPGRVELVDPSIGWLDGDRWEAFAQLRGRLWSELAFDPVRRTIVGFAQPGAGQTPVLHVLFEDRFIPKPNIEAPPRNMFRLVRDRGVLTAYGGQVFSGGQDTLWRLDGQRWREDPHGGWPEVNGQRHLVRAGDALVHVASKDLVATRRTGNGWNRFATPPTITALYDPRWSQQVAVIGGAALALIDARHQVWDWSPGADPVARSGAIVPAGLVPATMLGVVASDGTLVLVEPDRPHGRSQRGVLVGADHAVAFDVPRLVVLATAGDRVIAIDRDLGWWQLTGTRFLRERMLTGAEGVAIAAVADPRESGWWVALSALAREGPQTLHRITNGRLERVCELPTCPPWIRDDPKLAIDANADELVWWCGEALATRSLASVR